MKTFDKQAAQGDILVCKIDALPEGLNKVQSKDGCYTVSHSESGHAHVIREQKGVSFYANDNDPMTLYLIVDNTKCLLEHTRSFDTHQPIEVGPGIYRIRRQREYTPEGWRRVAD